MFRAYLVIPFVRRIFNSQENNYDERILNCTDHEVISTEVNSNDNSLSDDGYSSGH
jgi:hypothetical protein